MAGGSLLGCRPLETKMLKSRRPLEAAAVVSSDNFHKLLKPGRACLASSFPLLDLPDSDGVN